MNLPSIGRRLYADFLMPSRLEDFRALLVDARERGYAVEGVRDFWRASRGGAEKPTGRRLVLRHDVDTDPATARAMWDIERALGVASSYYFRLGTLDVALMREIESSGGEASYHYEELADHAKARGLATREAALADFAVIREAFRANLSRLRAETGLPMTVVASHGDFANRRLQTFNFEPLADPALRAELGIELETYDAAFWKLVDGRYADAPPPRFWNPESPVAALRAGAPVVYLLVHPRQWRANPRANLADNLRRLREGAGWSRRRATASASR